MSTDTHTYKILCLAPEDWNQTGKRVQHLLEALSRQAAVRSVLYVNPPVQHSLTDVLYGRAWPGLSGLPREQRTRSLLGLVRQIDAKVATYSGSTMVLPLSRFAAIRRAGMLERLNQQIYLDLVRARLWSRPGDQSIIWVAHPMYGDLARRLPRSLLIYDWMDDWEQFAALPVASAALLRRMTDDLVRRADQVFAVSETLFQRARVLNPHASLVPNGTHFAQFARSRPAGPDRLGAIPRPRLGYVGRIGDRVDFDLLRVLARARPDCSIVLVGPVWSNAHAAVAALAQEPNVYVLGARPYDEVPELIAGFDVCLIPHTLDRLTVSMDPIKLYDYLATGKPVVTTPIAGSERFADLIYVANDAIGFAGQVGVALAEADADQAARRQQRAREHTWAARAATMWATIQERLNAKAGDHRCQPSVPS